MRRNGRNRSCSSSWMWMVVVVLVSGCYDWMESDAWVIQGHEPIMTRTVASSLSDRKSRSMRISSSRLYSSDGSSGSEDSSGSDGISWKRIGLNEMQTLLRKAVEVEDYMEAKKWSDELGLRLSRDDGEDEKERKRRLSWRGLGTAPWLEDRLDALNFKFPTTIQIHSLESVNTLLRSHTDTNNNNNHPLSYDEGNDKLNLGVVISGSTGSGKTLAYLVPMLSTLSESLFTRQRIRVQSEESIDDVANDFLSRVAVQTSPAVRGHGRQSVGGGRNNVTMTPSSSSSKTSMGKSGTDVQTPLALIVVPTRELGIQIALQLYQLVGGSVKQTATQMPIQGGAPNMFQYKGPKGVKIGCILDEQEASYGLRYNLLQTDVAITTPQYLPKLLTDGDILANQLRVIIYDEADLCLEQTSTPTLQTLFNNNHNHNHNDNDDEEEEEEEEDLLSESNKSRLTYLVGASVTKSLAELCVRDAVLPKGKSYIATATQYAPLTFHDNTNTNTNTDTDDQEIHAATEYTSSPPTLQDLNACLDPGLRHELLAIPKGSAGLLCLTQLLRKELRDYQQQESETIEATTASTSNVDVGKNKPRVVVFFPDEEQAKASIAKLRDAMWGDFQLCVLLPNIGVNPLKMMEDFKNGKTSVMLATPNSVRGLDFPDLTHVYTLYIPPDPREYLHLSGRVGRIGQSGSVTGKGGRVTTIIHPQQIPQFQQMSQTLNFTPRNLDPSILQTTKPTTTTTTTDLEHSNIEDMRRYLEDSITLLDLTDDIDVNFDEVERRRQSLLHQDDDEDNDEDDNDDDEETME